MAVVADELILEHGGLAASYCALDEWLETRPQVGAELAEWLADCVRTRMRTDDSCKVFIVQLEQAGSPTDRRRLSRGQ
jgi:hypothetical protein